MYKVTQTSSIDQNAETPTEIMHFIMNKFDLTWDPCPPNFKIDGLRCQWREGAFVNPPFKHCKDWLAKAQSEQTYAVFLLPAIKLHCRNMEQIWPSIGGITLLTDLITFKNYKKPLNKAMTLLSMNCPSVPASCQAFYWSQVHTRTIEGLMTTLRPFNPTLITSRPSQQVPPILTKEQFVVLMPSRLDLKAIRDNASMLTEIIFCPTVRGREDDKDNLWIPPIILTKNVRIAASLQGMHPHQIPVQYLSLPK